MTFNNNLIFLPKKQQFDIVLVKIKVALILSDVLIKVQIVDFYPV